MIQLMIFLIFLLLFYEFYKSFSEYRSYPPKQSMEQYIILLFCVKIPIHKIQKDINR